MHEAREPLDSRKCSKCSSRAGRAEDASATAPEVMVAAAAANAYWKKNLIQCVPA